MANTKKKKSNKKYVAKNNNSNNRKSTNKTYNLNNTGQILKQDIINRKKQLEKNKSNNLDINKNYNNQVSSKEKNKQKYENRQKKYANNKNVKKPQVSNIIVIDQNIQKEEQYINNKNKNPKKINKETSNIKVVNNKNKKPKKLEIEQENIKIVNDKVKKEEEFKKKIKKFNIEKFPIKKKNIQDTKELLGKTFRIKRQELINNINNIKEKNDDSKLPLGSEKKDNKVRVKRYLKESIIYAVIITIINVLAILIFDYVNYLKLFDSVILNYVITIILSLVVSYAFAFFLDCLITEIWAKIKNKHKEGDINGNSWLE